MVMVGNMELEPERLERMTVDLYDQMIAAGMFAEDDPIELLDGVLVRKMRPHGEAHAHAIVRINNLLMRLLGARAAVAPQVPFRASPRSKPEPDLALWPADFQVGKPVEPLLVVEVADSSVRFDRLSKGPIYAQAGIPEYWIIDLAGDAVEVYRQPGPDGYQQLETLHRAATIRPVAFPDLEISVDDLLPRAT